MTIFQNILKGKNIKANLIKVVNFTWRSCWLRDSEVETVVDGDMSDW